MADKKEPPKKKAPRIQTITHAFVKGLAQATAKAAGPEAATKLVEGIQKIGVAWGPKTTTPEVATPAVPEAAVEPTEPEISEQDLTELEELIKVSENLTEEPKEPT